MKVIVKKPIKPGKRRPFTIVPDEAVDLMEGSVFATSEVILGDSSAPTIKPESTSVKIEGYLNGDGALGEKEVRIRVDAHVGAELIPLDLDVAYTVGTPDATELTFTEGAADEDMPVVEPPPVP